MTDTPAALELMTVTMPHGAPSLAAAAEQLGVKLEDMDDTFGVVPVDPDRGVYAVQVRADRLPIKPAQGGEAYHGPWSNPPIVPFGPVKGGTATEHDR